MTPKKETLLKQHVKAMTHLLYKETEPEQVESLAKIKATIREQMLQYIMLQSGVFLSSKLQEQ